MPRVAVWFIRASLCHLVGGFMLGGLLLAGKGITLPPALWSLRAVHIEMLLVGWMIQLVLGVAIWIFPRFVMHQRPRRSAVTAWLAFVLLNLGVVLAGAGGAPAAAGRVSELAAAASFAIHLWGRVSPTGLSAM